MALFFSLFLVLVNANTKQHEDIQEQQESAELIKGNSGWHQTIKEEDAGLEDQGMEPETMVAIYQTPTITGILT